MLSITGRLDKSKISLYIADIDITGASEVAQRCRQQKKVFLLIPWLRVENGE